MAQLGRDRSALKEEEKNIRSEFWPSQPSEEENNDFQNIIRSTLFDWNSVFWKNIPDEPGTIKGSNKNVYCPFSSASVARVQR